MTTQLPPSRTFGGGDYQEIKSLGQGGFAQVYLVEDNLRRPWALKQIKEDLIKQDPKILERFEREAQIQAGLKHPHIAGVHTFNPKEGYLVIDFIEGRTLRKLVDDDFPEGMDLDTALKILQPIEKALTYIHEDAGFAHLDITPRNILIQETRTRRGSTEQRIVLADFGLARVIDSDGRANPTIIAGSPGYWAPEQRGLTKDKPGTRSDIYSLGVVIGVMLTGRKPEEVLDILRGTSNTLAPMLPPEVKRVLQRATDEDPGNRYATVKGLVTAFMQAVDAFRTDRPIDQGKTLTDNFRKRLSFGSTNQLSQQGQDLAGARPLKKIVVMGSPYYSIVATVVLLGFVAWTLVQSRPTTYPIKLKGLDLGTYCASYGMSAGTSACSKPIDLNDACNWQWGRNDLHNVFSNSTDSDSGICYDSHNHPVMGSGGPGINDMEGYCTYRFHYGMPVAIANKPGTPAGWVCQQQIDPTLVCMWQYDRTDVQARNVQGSWTCYSSS